MSDFLLWLDVETTGLDPHAAVLLEIAAVLTELDKDFTIVGEPYQRVLRLPEKTKVTDLDPVVLRMHTNNGLFEEAMKSRYDSRQGFEGLKAWKDRTLKDEQVGQVYLAGSSVHFDKAWVQNVAGLFNWGKLGLSHRHFDLTTLRLFLPLVGSPQALGAKDSPHRALPDILDDIRVARLVTKLFNG